ncbi:MAG: Transcriptional regulatory protein WalR [Legionella sp.]|uniref:response regulator n=1 Tax=Legionella sp. TaxID=459 RepID=UPI003D0B9689
MTPELQKILYAEDDKDIRTIVMTILQRKTNYQIECCDTGLKALEIAQWFVPDLIILDVNMPDMDGITTFQALKTIELLKKVPVIFMTAKVQNHEIDNYYDLGVNYVIVKPFSPKELVELIQQTWNKSITACSE